VGDAARPPDVHLDSLFVERTEESEPLEMIEVQMGEQDVDPPKRTRQRPREAAHPRPGVEDEDGALGADDLDARGVSPVTSRLRPWRCQRAARAPERDPRGYFTSQKRAIPPTNRFP
jgi:hypothetical protein